MNKDEKIREAAKALSVAMTEAAESGVDFEIELSRFDVTYMGDADRRLAFAVHVTRTRKAEDRLC